MRQRRNQLRGACYLHVLARILLLRSAGRLHRSFLDLTFTMSPPTDIQDDIEYEKMIHLIVTLTMLIHLCGLSKHAVSTVACHDPTAIHRPTRSIYALTRQEITKGLANRFVHSRTYIILYLGMAALSVTTVVLSLVDGCPVSPSIFSKLSSTWR